MVTAVKVLTLKVSWKCLNFVSQEKKKKLMNCPCAGERQKGKSGELKVVMMLMFRLDGGARRGERRK
jgi:hypothetical protein